MLPKTRSLLSLSWQSMAYGLGQFGRGLVLYLILPILTRFLGPAEYGVIALVASFITFTDVVSDAGLPSATFRLYHEQDDAQYRRRVLGSSVLLFVIYAVAMATAVYFLSDRLAGWILADAGRASLMQVGAVLMVFMTLFSFGQILYRIQVRPLTNSVAVIFLIVLQTGLSLIFVGLLGLGAYGYWWGQLLGSAIALAFMVISLRHSLHFSISRAEMSALTRYALPMIPASLSLWALRLIDRPMILHFYDLRAVGIYDLGYKVASLLLIAITPFNAAWPAFSFSHMRDDDAPQLYRDVLTGIATLSTILGLAIFALRRELVLLFGSPQYIQATEVVGWVVIAQIALSLFPILSIGPRITKKTTTIAWLSGAAAISNITLNFVLLPRYGIVGAAMATMIGYVILAGATYFAGQREFHFPLDYRRLGKLVLAAVLSIVYVLVIETVVSGSLLAFALKALSVGLFVGLLLAMRFVRVSQLREIARFALGRLAQRKKSLDPVQ